MGPSITKAEVRLDFTFADGTRRDFAFELDDPEGKEPIAADLSVEIDVEDATDYTVDSFKRHVPGDRQAVSVSVSGRGKRVQAPAELNIYQRMARSMEIFAAYPIQHGGHVAAAHDEIWAGPDPETVSKQHRAELEELGWTVDRNADTFHLNV